VTLVAIEGGVARLALAGGGNAAVAALLDDLVRTAAPEIERTVIEGAGAGLGLVQIDLARSRARRSAP
jgi:hypothetical protein